MIEIIGLKKSFGNRIITNELDLSIKKGEFLAIIGRSGEGKSVLLKQIIGLIEPDAGEVYINGELVSARSGKAKEEIFKKCGYVFQFAALLDSLTVFENIAITLLEKNISEEKILPLVLEKIRNVGLRDDILEKYPNELSGGMKKRVGLARTLMQNPEIIIYDEPTTGLDPITVKMIHELIKNTQISSNVTSLVISHDIEIFKYADTIAMLHEGKIVYTGSAATIWECDNPHVYQFIRGLEEGPITQPNNTTR